MSTVSRVWAAYSAVLPPSLMVFFLRIWAISKDDLAGFHLKPRRTLWTLSWNQFHLCHRTCLLVHHQAFQGSFGPSCLILKILIAHIFVKEYVLKPCYNLSTCTLLFVPTIKLHCWYSTEFWTRPGFSMISNPIFPQPHLHSCLHDLLLCKLFQFIDPFPYFKCFSWISSQWWALFIWFVKITRAAFIIYPHYVNLSFATDGLDKRYKLCLSNIGKNIQHVQQRETINTFCTTLLTV